MVTMSHLHRDFQWAIHPIGDMQAVVAWIFGNLETKGFIDLLKACFKLLVDSAASVCRLSTWQNTVSTDMTLLAINPRDYLYHVK